MHEIFLLLDFLVPAVFFLLGKALKEKYGFDLKKESGFVLILSLLFAPILYVSFPLAVQGFFCSCLIFLQSILILRRSYRIGFH